MKYNYHLFLLLKILEFHLYTLNLFHEFLFHSILKKKHILFEKNILNELKNLYLDVNFLNNLKVWMIHPNLTQHNELLLHFELGYI